MLINLLLVILKDRKEKFNSYEKRKKEYKYIYSNYDVYDLEQDDFYCVILHNRTFYTDEELKEINVDSLYVRYYIIRENIFSNYNTFNSHIWQLQ